MSKFSGMVRILPFHNLLILLFPIMLSAQNSDNRVSAQYQNLCSSCHGTQLESFYGNSLIKSGSLDDIIDIIDKGNLDKGMPGFGSAINLNDKKAIATFITNTVKSVPKPEKAFVSPLKIHYTKDAVFKVDTFISDIEVPWGMVWLDNSSLLVSERQGTAFVFNGQIKKDIKGLPKVKNKGQGGLMDVIKHPNYAENGWIYFSYSKPDLGKKDHASTAIIRGRIVEQRFVDQEIIFVAQAKNKKRHHWGCRMAFDKEGYLFFSIGDRGQRDDFPQSVTNENGKIHRIYDDGRIPKDNPFYNKPNAIKSIYSFGHRNQQGIAFHPETGKLWAHEHGPKGGDELNIINPGKNYGWPVISYGINYSGTKFTEDTVMTGMEQPELFWRPSIAPCGMTFVSSEKYPNWKNSILIGSLSFKYLERVYFDDNNTLQREKLLNDIGRVRSVIQGEDGYIYVGIEKPGKILRLLPYEN